MEFNLATLECICNCLQIEMPAIKTSVYEKEITNAIDARFLIQAKYKPKFNQKEYFQVFKDRNGFIENLSVLDLLFNEGYYSSTSSQTIKKELCLEAMRLTLLLIDYHSTNKPQTNALMALFCFHSSRFEARTNQDGQLVLLKTFSVSIKTSGVARHCQQQPRCL